MYRLGAVSLFDYSNHRASSVDAVSSGLHGIRLPDGKLHGVKGSDYSLFSEHDGGRLPYSIGAQSAEGKDTDRRLCVLLAAQVLILLDAFIFPESLDTSLPTSQLHGLALVRDSEARLGVSQGPLVCSAIRLSFLLLAVLEPCSMKFLQCASRLRCLLGWALELVGESSVPGQTTISFHETSAQLDQLLLAIVLHSHRALRRCAVLLADIESTSYSKFFSSRESQRKYQRRLMRAALELRDIVSTVFRGRTEVLRNTLSSVAFESLRSSLEGNTPTGKNHSKETVVRDFLSSGWVKGYQDVETRFELIIPEQVSMDTIPLNENHESAIQGVFAIQKLSKESSDIVADYEKALDTSFKCYLEAQRKWSETDAVRELEYDGDMTQKRLSEKQKSDASDSSKEAAMRRIAADNRYHAIQKRIGHMWHDQSHWQLPRYGDNLGRKMVLVENLSFDSHAAASYAMALGKEQQKEEEHKRKRLLEKEKLSEMMRRNADAFVSKDFSVDTGADEDSIRHQASDGESSLDQEGTHSQDGSSELASVEKSELDSDVDADVDESWDKVTFEEIVDVDAEGVGDGWARTFIWSESESVVARFEPVTIISLQTYVEGKVVLTTHGLYFLPTNSEVNVMTKEPIEMNDPHLEHKGRRWRLSRLVEIYGRRQMLRAQALELFFADGTDILLNFPSGVRERDRFHAKLRNSCKVSNCRGLHVTI